MNSVTCLLLLAFGIGADATCAIDGDKTVLANCTRQFRDDILNLKPCTVVETYATCISPEISSCNDTVKNKREKRIEGLNQQYNCSARLSFGTPSTPIPSTSQLPGNTTTPIPSTSQLPGNTTTPTSASPSLTGAFRGKNGVYIYNIYVLHAVYYLYTYLDRRCQF